MHALAPTLALMVLGHLAFFVVRSTVITGAVMRWLGTPFAMARRVYRRAYSQGQWSSELRAALKVVAFDAVVLSLVRHYELLHLARPSLGNAALSFALTFVWYELWFYASHRALHTRWLAPLHAQHHTAKVMHPLTSLSFSLVERAILQVGALGFVALASRHLPLSAPGVVGYFFLNYVLNVLGHSNVELMPAGFVATAPGRVFITTTFHAMHHARYQGHYGLFTRVLDRAFKTEFRDYPAMHGLATRGEGPERLGARVSA